MNKFKNSTQSFFRSIRVGWFLAFRQVRRSSKWVTGLIIFIMMLTFLNMVVVSGLLVGLISGSYKQFKESYSGDVLLTSAPGRTYIENSPRLIAYMQGNSNVTSFVPRYAKGVSLLASLSENAKNKEKPNQGNATVVGVDPGAEEKVTNFSKFIIKGESLVQGEEGYILLGANLLKEFSSFGDVDIPGLELLKNVDVGTKIRMTMGENGNKVSKEFIVKGIVKSKVDQISNRAFITDTEMRRMLPVNQWEVQEISVRTKPGFDRVVVDDLKDIAGYSAVRIQTSEEAIPSFLRDIETTFGIMGNLLSVIALVVASITIFIVIFINAVTRRKFIGIMKGIGISPLAVKMAYVFQSIFYGVIGSGLGLALVFGFLKPFFDQNPIDFPFSDGILVATYSGAFIRVAILMTVTLLAGYIPASMIVRKNTLDSILGR